MVGNFKIHTTLDAWKSGEGDQSMRIGGIVSTDQLDRQGERIVQEGLDFSPFLTTGWFNDNHGQKTTDVLGYPTDARFVRKGEALPNGKVADANGWWAEGYLLNTEEGRRVFSLCQAMSKSPRRLGFSIEGKVQERDSRRDHVIKRATVKNVAVTHCPVNVGTEMEALAKALTAGSAIGASEGGGPGDGAALRTESLEGALADEEEDEDETVIVNKASNAELPPDAAVDEIDAVEGWATAMQSIATDSEPAAPLTKAEARVIVRSKLPHLSADAVDAIIANAAGGTS